MTTCAQVAKTSVYVVKNSHFWDWTHAQTVKPDKSRHIYRLSSYLFTYLFIEKAQRGFMKPM